MAELPFDRAALWPLVLDRLAGWRRSSPPGALQLFFVAPPARVHGSFALSEGVAAADELFLRDLVASVHQVGSPGVVVAVARPDGRPGRQDRRLRAALEGRIGGPTRMVELLVVGPDEHRLVGRRPLAAPAHRP